jgi:phosphatidylserine/phosphatidylglycerophosphate/cardiolipin synthase-like enzyme
LPKTATTIYAVKGLIEFIHPSIHQRRTSMTQNIQGLFPERSGTYILSHPSCRFDQIQGGMHYKIGLACNGIGISGGAPFVNLYLIQWFVLSNNKKKKSLIGHDEK